MRKRLFIRADGNSDIGLGHIMRSMTIANEFRKHGYECIFMSSFPIVDDIFTRNGFKYIEIEFPYNIKSIEEAEYIVELIKFQKIDYLLVDSYYINNDYLKILKKFTKLICINSTKKYLITDYLVNENIASDRNYYSNLYKDSITKLLIGNEYSLIRDEFKRIQNPINPIVKNILVTTGGGDQYNFMCGFLNRIKKVTKFHEFSFIFISGACNNHYEELQQEAQGEENVTIIQNTTNISTYMRESDLAISTGGTTVLELAVLGIPTIGISVADDQVEGLKYMNDKGMIRYAGRITSNSFWDNVLLNFIDLVSDSSVRMNLSQTSSSYIDGKGAERVFYAITEDIEMNGG